MLLPFVKKLIYSYISRESRSIEVEVEAKINIMHATYAVLHSSGSENPARLVFQKLYPEHLSKKSMEVSFELMCMMFL